MWPARIEARAFSAKRFCRVSCHERAHPSISSDGRIPPAYLVLSRAKPVKASVLEIKSRGRWTWTWELLRDSARRTDVPTPAIKSRRFILELLLRPQAVRTAVHAESGSLFTR